MYSVDESGPLGVILIHRGVQFLAVACVSVLAAFNAEVRVAAMLVTAFSLLGFLITYATAGAPKRLRTIAIVDAIALIPLTIVSADVWAKPSA